MSTDGIKVKVSLEGDARSLVASYAEAKRSIAGLEAGRSGPGGLCGGRLRLASYVATLQGWLKS